MLSAERIKEIIGLCLQGEQSNTRVKHRITTQACIVGNVRTRERQIQWMTSKGFTEVSLEVGLGAYLK